MAANCRGVDDGNCALSSSHFDKSLDNIVLNPKRVLRCGKRNRRGAVAALLEPLISRGAHYAAAAHHCAAAAASAATVSAAADNAGDKGGIGDAGAGEGDGGHAAAVLEGSAVSGARLRNTSRGVETDAAGVQQNAAPRGLGHVEAKGRARRGGKNAGQIRRAAEAERPKRRRAARKCIEMGL